MEGVVARPDPAFWRGRRVLLTGHTGFKGAWAARMLSALGARVTGLALDPPPGPSAFEALGVAGGLSEDRRGDVRHAAAVGEAVAGAEIVLHLAAQAIVSEGYRDPAGTWSTNVTGLLTLLEALRGGGAAAVVVATSDKVYRNDGHGRRFVESDPLGGDDPYSASKAAGEILAASHRAAFPELPPIATARAGNVVGGGDFGRDRLIPDLVRAQSAGVPLVVRRPEATRPFQHVLDVVAGYLVLAERVAGGGAPPAVNLAPAEAELSVRDLLAAWEGASGRAVDWRAADAPPFAEKPRLALDGGLARRVLGWEARLATVAAVADTAAWYGEWRAGGDMAAASAARVERFLGGAGT